MLLRVYQIEITAVSPDRSFMSLSRHEIIRRCFFSEMGCEVKGEGEGEGEGGLDPEK